MRLPGTSLVMIFVMLIAAFAPGVSAQDARRDQITAAQSQAVERLRMQIAEQSIGDSLTVQSLLDRTRAGDQLVKTLCRAQQIGGPRWLDDQTCQVRLEIEGTRVAQTLAQIAASNPRTSPVAADMLAARLQNWDQRTFTATGTSTGAKAIDWARPPRDGDAWANVSDDARKQAVVAAKANAISNVMESVKTISLGNDKTVAQQIERKEVRDAMEQWLAGRPVTQVEFREDRQVRLTLAAPGGELFEAFRASVSKDALPQDEAGIERIRSEFVSRVSSSSGRGTAIGGDQPKAPAIRLPETPPDWTNSQLDAEGESPASNTGLKAARGAEADAIAKLRAKIDTLVLTKGLTLGDAAKQDPNLAHALDRAASRARISKMDYQSDGSARVRVVIDLRYVWNEIRSSP